MAYMTSKGCRHKYISKILFQVNWGLSLLCGRIKRSSLERQPLASMNMRMEKIILYFSKWPASKASTLSTTRKPYTMRTFATPPIWFIMSLKHTSLHNSSNFPVKSQRIGCKQNLKSIRNPIRTQTSTWYPIPHAHLKLKIFSWEMKVPAKNAK